MAALNAPQLLEYYRRAALEAAALRPRQGTATQAPPTQQTQPQAPTPTPAQPSPSPQSPSPQSPSPQSPSPQSPSTTTPSTISAPTPDDSTSPNSSNTTIVTTNPNGGTITTTISQQAPVPRPSPGTTSTSRSTSSGYTSSYVTTRTTTYANGQVATVTEVLPTFVPDANADGNNSPNVNTGAIVGGVVGGVAFILLLVGLFIWWRKRSRFDDFEDNLFDPDHTIKRPMSTADPHTDLLTSAAVPEAARNITPYSYGNQPAGSAAGTGQGSSVGWQPEMRPPSSYYAYDNASSAGGTHYPPSMAGTDATPNPYGAGYRPPSLAPAAAGVGAGVVGQAALNRDPTVSSTTSSSYYQRTSYPPPQVSPGSPQFSQPYNQPMPAPAPTPSPPNPRAAKEREAFQRTQHGSGKGGWAVANQSMDSGRGDVVVHEDRGRVSTPGEDEAPRDAEIPPTYESIRHNDQGTPAPPPVQPATGN